MEKSRLLIVIIFAFLTSSCSSNFLTEHETVDVSKAFLPPSPPSPPVEYTTPTSASPTGEIDQTMPFDSYCTDNLTFINDISILDGSEVIPGEKLDKRWEVQNSGECNWDQRYRLRLIAGPDMGAPGEQALFPARSGSRAELRMIFTAPNEADRYRSAWQAYNPQGEPFGDPFFIDIIVVSPKTPTP